jgi:uncharacterized membrane protein
MSSQNRIVSAIANAVAVILIVIAAATHDYVVLAAGIVFVAVGVGAIFMSAIYRRRWQLARRVHYEASKSN